EVTASIAPGELDRIASVRLHQVAWLHRDQRRRDDLALDATLRELPIQRVARWPRLITNLQLSRGTEFLHEHPDGARRVGNLPERADLTVSPGLRHGDRDCLSVHIQTYESGTLRHRPAPFVCSSALRVSRFAA